MTMDNGMDVSPSWEELRDERDALAYKLAESDHALMQLGRLKAEWQAEVLSEMIVAIPFSEELAREMLKHKSEELRRQAEEPSP